MPLLNDIKLKTEFILCACVAANWQVVDFLSVNGIKEIADNLKHAPLSFHNSRIFYDLVRMRMDTQPPYKGPIIAEPVDQGEKLGQELFFVAMQR